MNSIKRNRVLAELSQATLAAKIGVTQSVVSQWESGKVFPRSDKLPRLAQLFGCSIEALYDAHAGADSHT